MRVEKNIEIPDKTAGRPVKYDWVKMEKGDSFLIENCDTKKQKSICMSAYIWLKDNKPTLRLSYRRDVKNVRFWLVKR